jgi:hypothetical protein
MDHVLKRHFPGFNAAIYERLFFVIDFSGNGNIRYDEFLCATFLFVRGSRESKFQCTSTCSRFASQRQNRNECPRATPTASACCCRRGKSGMISASKLAAVGAIGCL